MKRGTRFPDAPMLSRRRATSAAKFKIYVFCEGSTEEDYLRWFAAEIGAGLVSVIPVGNVGVPETVVAEAAKKKKELSAAARKRGSDSFDALYSVWAMFDKDDFEVDEPKLTAAQNGIEVAFSNPCFEVWGIIHLEDWNGPEHRKVVQSRLKEIMPPYDHSRNPYFDYPRMTEAAHSDACGRAKAMNAALQKDGDGEGNPSTSVYRLTESILVSSGKLPSLKSVLEKIDAEIAELQALPSSDSSEIQGQISKLHNKKKRLNTAN